MNFEGKTDMYEITPCQIEFGGMPILHPQSETFDAKTIEISGIDTLETTVEDAKCRSDYLLAFVFQRLKHGDHQPLVNLLDEHPEFVANQQVRGELNKWVATPRSYRKPGRPRNGALRHPLIIAGIVDSLTTGALRMNKGMAFECVADWLCISTSTARDNYYHARSQERFKSLLIQTGPKLIAPIDTEFGRAIEASELLESGKEVRCTLANTAEGNIVATFSAK